MNEFDDTQYYQDSWLLLLRLDATVNYTKNYLRKFQLILEAFALDFDKIATYFSFSHTPRGFVKMINSIFLLGISLGKFSASTIVSPSRL